MTGGPIWGAASEELNATILEWPPGGVVDEHVNEERDVVLAVLAGGLALTLDGTTRELAAGEAVIVEKGRRRALAAGPGGVRYLSAHLRRPPLQIGSPRGPAVR